MTGRVGSILYILRVGKRCKFIVHEATMGWRAETKRNVNPFTTGEVYMKLPLAGHRQHCKDLKVLEIGPSCGHTFAPATYSVSCFVIQRYNDSGSHWIGVFECVC
jgi:hypothetical protein